MNDSRSQPEDLRAALRQRRPAHAAAFDLMFDPRYQDRLASFDQRGFGRQVAAEVQRRGPGRAQRTGDICDGPKDNRTRFEPHLLPPGSLAILDFLRLVASLYAAAPAVEATGSAAAWALYERWQRQAWAGHVSRLLTGLRAGCAKLGPPPGRCSDDGPRTVAAAALGYVENNRERMDDPRYRRLGLPVSGAAVEGTIKPMNRHMRGTEKFWEHEGSGGGVASACGLRERRRPGRALRVPAAPALTSCRDRSPPTLICTDRNAIAPRPIGTRTTANGRPESDSPGADAHVFFSAGLRVACGLRTWLTGRAGRGTEVRVGGRAPNPGDVPPSAGSS